MKFENPIMNISMFEVENIVTDSSVEPVTKDAMEAANTYLADTKEKLTFTF